MWPLCSPRSARLLGLGVVLVLGCGSSIEATKEHPASVHAETAPFRSSSGILRTDASIDTLVPFRQPEASGEEHVGDNDAGARQTIDASATHERHHAH